MCAGGMYSGQPQQMGMMNGAMGQQPTGGMMAGGMQQQQPNMMQVMLALLVG